MAPGSQATDSQATPGAAAGVGASSTVARIPLWVDLRAVPVNKRIGYFAAARQAGAEHVVLDKGDPHAERTDVEVLTVDGKHQLRHHGHVVGRLVAVHDRKSQERAASAEGLVVVDATDWRVIPLENLVAARRDRPHTLFALARSPEQARLFGQTLEVGVHGIVLAPTEPSAINQADEHLRLVHRLHEVPHGVVDTIDQRAPSSTVVTGVLKRHPAGPAPEPRFDTGSSTNGVPTTPSAAQATPSLASAAPAPLAAPSASQSILPAPSSSPSSPSSSPSSPSSPSSSSSSPSSPSSSPALHHAPAAQSPQAKTPGLPASSYVLETATIVALEDAGMGDRVCVDTTSLLGDGEGLLIGSTAHGFALVAAETQASQFIASRPFRVNAGAVHSYVLGPDGKTRYLTELAAGQLVETVTPQGQRRTVAIGRCKVERRPHTLVRWTTPTGQTGMVVLQTAETVCLVGPDGRRLPVTSLKPNDAVLVHLQRVGRHAGMPADGHLDER